MSKEYELSGIGPSVELGKRGPRIKDNSGAVEHRNQADSAFAIARGADPVDSQDFVTKGYLETRAHAIVTGQIDGGAPPAVAPEGTVFICTTSGGAYTENYLYRSDGSSWVEIIPVEGLRISVTDALTGGNIEFEADHLYLWDADGSQWVDVGPAPQGTAMVKTARATLSYLNTGANAVVSVPANAIATRVSVVVTQAWDDADVTLEVGDASDPDRLMGAAGNDLQKTDVQFAICQHLYGSQTEVQATITNNGGTPTQGQLTLIVQYDIA